MPKYIFSEGKIRVQPGVFSPKREKHSSDFGVLILVTPEMSAEPLADSTHDEGQDSDEHNSERLPESSSTIRHLRTLLVRDAERDKHRSAG